MRLVSLVVPMVAAVLLASPTTRVSVSVRSAPAQRLLTYLWKYQNWLLRPYVTGVSLSGGHVVVVNGRSRLAGATANVHETLHDQPKLADAARHICRIAAAAVQTLHLRPAISAVQVWSVEGDPVARC